MPVRSKPRKRPASRSLPPLERYTDQRVAECLLSNAVDAKDYARAVKLVRKMGLDPEKVDHDRPIGVE